MHCALTSDSCVCVCESDAWCQCRTELTDTINELRQELNYNVVSIIILHCQTIVIMFSLFCSISHRMRSTSLSIQAPPVVARQQESKVGHRTSHSTLPHNIHTVPSYSSSLQSSCQRPQWRVLPRGCYQMLLHWREKCFCPHNLSVHTQSSKGHVKLVEAMTITRRRHQREKRRGNLVLVMVR